MADIYAGDTDLPPLHGYRGAAPAVAERWPCGLTGALSREAGARGRAARRAAFVRRHLTRLTADPYAYDLLLNAGRLGEEACAELIAQAAKAKRAHADFASASCAEER